MNIKQFTSISLALAVVAMLNSPLAGPRGTNRPLTGRLTGEATFAFGVSECLPVNGVGVQTTTVAEGNISHMGQAKAVFTHCPGPPYIGRVTFSAANGDELWATYEDEDGVPPFVLHILKGTGRFANAEGIVGLSWEVEWVFDENGNPDWSAAWPWWATMEGTVSY